MSFYKQLHQRRKENISFLVIILPANVIPHITGRTSYQNSNKPTTRHSRRASVCTLHTDKKASLTIETALAIPLFFLALLCLIYLLEMMAIQVRIHTGMHDAARKAVEQAYVVPILSPGSVESDLVESIGSASLDRSIVVGGSGGLDCSRSYLMPGTGILHMTVKYEVKLPIPTFGLPNLTYIEKLTMKGWTGYVKGGLDANDDRIVYLTDTASVYHKDYHCTYLDLSIQMVQGSSVSDLRNAHQGRYHACSKCARGNGHPSGPVYVTSEGDCYHTSLGCSGLKRKIYAVPLSQAVGKGACTRCGQ